MGKAISYCWYLSVFAFVLAGACAQGPAPVSETGSKLAETPPLGWNSWDAYGTTVNENQFKANARWLADHLKSSGWEYVVVDMEWFVTNPLRQGNSSTSQFSLDDEGRYTPAINRFPSSEAGAGFKPLVEYVHGLGLKFGIHILRGIPKKAVERNLPIEASSYHAAEAANTQDVCPWNPDNFGMDSSKPAAQAYYDSIARLYASWGVDLIKADCISSHPYKGDDIKMLSLALRKTGRPIVLSLSPGAAPIEKLEEMRQYAQMWRISDDVWDLWHSTVDYPQGVGDQFSRVAKWAAYSQPGHWPDADMLPLGYLGPAPGWGTPRWTRLTHDEQRTMLTLWCMFRSPLMIGGDLPSSDAWTTSLLTNPEVISVDQHSTFARPGSTSDRAAVWISRSTSADVQYVAVFNLTDRTSKLQYPWKELGLDGQSFKVRDLWERRDLGTARAVAVTVPAHGAVLYAVSSAAEK